MVRGKCTLGRGLGPSPQENVSLPLSKQIYSSVFTGRQGLTLCHYFKLQLGKKLGEKLPPSRLNPVMHNIYCKQDILVGRIFWLKGSLYCNHTVRRYLFG